MNDKVLYIQSHQEQQNSNAVHDPGLHDQIMRTAATIIGHDEFYESATRSNRVMVARTVLNLKYGMAVYELLEPGMLFNPGLAKLSLQLIRAMD